MLLLICKLKIYLSFFSYQNILYKRIFQLLGVNDQNKIKKVSTFHEREKVKRFGQHSFEYIRREKKITRRQVKRKYAT
jgi:hypothetical protein